MKRPTGHRNWRLEDKVWGQLARGEKDTPKSRSTGDATKRTLVTGASPESTVQEAGRGGHSRESPSDSKAKYVPGRAWSGDRDRSTSEEGRSRHASQFSCSSADRGPASRQVSHHKGTLKYKVVSLGQVEVWAGEVRRYLRTELLTMTGQTTWHRPRAYFFAFKQED